MNKSKIKTAALPAGHPIRLLLGAAILFRITSLIWLPGFVLLALWPGAGRRWLRAAGALIPAWLAMRQLRGSGLPSAR